MKFTIVGYWVDNDQPWIEHVDAANAQEAAAKAVAGLGPDDGDADELVVVEAFRGHLKGKLANAYCATISNMEYEL